MSQPVQLSEDDIDDILYFARANEVADLEECVKSLAGKLGVSEKEIVEKAVDPVTGNTPLHYAAANGHREILVLINNLHKSTDSQGSSSSPLSPNMKNLSGNTPLHYAAQTGQLPMVKLLLGANADPMITNEAGHSAIYEAQIHDKEDVVEWLTENLVAAMDKKKRESGDASGGAEEEEEVVMAEGEAVVAEDDESARTLVDGVSEKLEKQSI
ncbi:ankyrin [Aulographum hederae CBS 113979]|uniref:Ankyrin n=1 Tax=Aulographum hederae CBS 113979 TaxID=1176131 RepID=A0A6G1H0G8_9PEZI|nr:ankyrin [Aulographum hederae CBS 113979]